MSPRASADAAPTSQDGSSKRRPLQEVLRMSCREVEGLTGRHVDGVSSAHRTDEGWVLSLELVELERVPASTSVLGSYQVSVNEDGAVLEYERTRRYYRNRAGDEEYE
jgi:Gas vesicle synthesis protein GvpO